MLSLLLKNQNNDSAFSCVRSCFHSSTSKMLVVQFDMTEKVKENKVLKTNKRLIYSMRKSVKL